MGSKIIDQALGQNWASYNADCIFMMKNLPSDSVDFNIHSPPFLALYIYSDSIADLGNTDSEQEFFEGYSFALEEMYRVHKPGGYLAIHCKDTMKYKSSHGYAGLYDFPGQIIKFAEMAGWTFERWITIWKDPVVEMQRTKTYGLLHMSFKKRAEVTRQGCADYVLVFRKRDNITESVIDMRGLLPESAIERIVHQWTNKDEPHFINEMSDNMPLSIWTEPSFYYTDDFVNELSERTQPGRLAVIDTCPYQAGKLTERFQDQGSWKFHSRCALTNGSQLIVFRNWTKELKNNYKELNGKVKHNLYGPGFLGYEERLRFNDGEFWRDIKPDDDLETIERHFETEIRQIPIYDPNGKHQDYIGNNPPSAWHDNTYYSILVWQRYASPVWFDLEGLPGSHEDCWMDIDQTDVLNHGLKSEKVQRHICPLQLGLIERLISEYTERGNVVLSPYGGIGSEGVKAVEMHRKAILAELKPDYWELANKHLAEQELKSLQASFL